MGWDSSRTVRVALDDAGRVSEVELRAQWLRDLDVDGLVGALSEAMTIVRMAQLEDRARESAEDLNTGGRANVWAAAAGEGRATPDRLGGDNDALAAIVDDVDYALDLVDRWEQTLGDSWTTEVEGRSPDHRVTVRFSLAAGLTGLSGDRYWLETTPAHRVAASVRDACRAAYEQVDQATARAFESLGPLRGLPGVSGLLDELGRSTGTTPRQ
ncbi:hypothetical protein ACFP2T_45760 [Plantactinospora solaniradicis]|uniref:YbaB/EbfC family DNA-binding protein n=1 Tax=Plantactinospora solaniradicis TaxID=1723736 RepID=A0ABW1KP21_9ACTN